MVPDVRMQKTMPPTAYTPTVIKNTNCYDSTTKHYTIYYHRRLLIVSTTFQTKTAKPKTNRLGLYTSCFLFAQLAITQATPIFEVVMRYLGAPTFRPSAFRTRVYTCRPVSGQHQHLPGSDLPARAYSLQWRVAGRCCDIRKMQFSPHLPITRKFFCAFDHPWGDLDVPENLEAIVAAGPEL